MASIDGHYQEMSELEAFYSEERKFNSKVNFNHEASIIYPKKIKPI